MPPLACILIWYRQALPLYSCRTLSVFTRCCTLQGWFSMISFSIWLKFYLVRKMDEHDGCEGSTLRTVCLNCSLWEEQTQSLSYMDWTHRPSISIPERILTDSLHTRCRFHFILSSFFTVPSLWTYQTFQVMRIGIQDCLIEALQSRMQTPLRYTFIPLLSPTMIPSLWMFNTASSNAWEAFNPSVVASEQMQHSLGICTVTVVALGVCRTVNEADLDSRCCWFSQSLQSGKVCIPC